MGKTNREIKENVLDMQSGLAKKLMMVDQAINQLIKKTDVIHQAMKHMFHGLGDVQIRLEVLKTLGIRKDMFAEADYEATFNEIVKTVVDAEEKKNEAKSEPVQDVSQLPV